MRKWKSWLKRLPLWMGIFFLSIGLGGALLDGFQSNEDLLIGVETRLESDFQGQIKEIEKHSRDSFPDWLGQKKVIVLDYTLKGKLLRWSDHSFIPSEFVIQQHLKMHLKTILSEKNRVYYSMKFFSDSTVRFILFPLITKYLIQNEYLKDYVYLGRYQNDESINSIVTAQDFILGHSLAGINVRDELGDFLFSIKVNNAEPFRVERRVWILIFILLGLLLLFWFLFNKYKNDWKRELLLISIVVFIRILALLFHFPTLYADLALFSPIYLALNELNPSLGDFLLNCSFLLLIIYFLYTRINSEVIVNYIVRLGLWSKIAYNFVILLIILVLLKTFFDTWESLVLDSKIPLDISSLTTLQPYSYLIFLCVGILTASLFLITFFLVNISLQIIANGNYKNYWLLIILVSINVLIAYLLFNDVILCLFYVGYLCFIYLQVYFAKGELALNLVSNVLIASFFSLLSIATLSKALENKIFQELEQHSNRFDNPREILTEYVFDEIAEEIQNDRSLWSRDSVINPVDTIGQDLISRIVHNHLVHQFKGYDFRLYVFDFWGRRLDNQYDQPPYFRLEMKRLKDFSTLSKHLYFVPHPRKANEFLYIGRFIINSQIYGRVSLQIEMEQKPQLSGKLYPQLLLDQSINQRLNLPNKFSYAIYEKNNIIKSNNPNIFPLELTKIHLKYDDKLDNNSILKSNYKYILIKKISAEKTLFIQTPTATFLDYITNFSFLFYFYCLLGIVLFIPKLLKGIIGKGWDYLKDSFSFRIQFFLFVLSFIPLIILGVFTIPLFGKFYYQDAENNLQTNLGRVAQYFKDEGGNISEFWYNWEKDLGQGKELLNRVSNLLSCDINIYNNEGKLLTTTRQKIYQTSLSSVYINPLVLQELQLGNRSELILNEQIGNLHYFSGYLILANENDKIIGYLNIPYLMQQRLLEAQVQRFISYLLNVYLVLALILAFVSVFISKTLTNPLRLLRNKLDKTKLEELEAPLVWNAKDEIGAIIQSYNEMLSKLLESKERLTKSERELGWRQMAKQVAHEIKNPLTPMKLSIQYLIKTLKESTVDNILKSKIEKTSNTLLSQIDSLTTIANSFSEFANLPKANPEQLELSSLLSDIYNLFNEAPEATFYIEIPQHSIYIIADKNYIIRVFVNIIRNALQAIKTPEGTIHIKLIQKDNNAIVSIKDNGTGIPLELQSKIFEPNFSTKTSGSGLGLAISKQIIEALGGQISFQSIEEKGTTFYLTFSIIK